jgi:arylsulfatase A-like enzyme
LKKILIAALVIPFLSFNSALAQKSPKPNIIILLADDLGYGELGAYGQKEIKTPFLDYFYSQGMSFTDFYTGTAVCSPSRASLMRKVI